MEKDEEEKEDDYVKEVEEKIQEFKEMEKIHANDLSGDHPHTLSQRRYSRQRK